MATVYETEALRVKTVHKDGEFAGYHVFAKFYDELFTHEELQDTVDQLQAVLDERGER